jgi:hypothetical protein
MIFYRKSFIEDELFPNPLFGTPATDAVYGTMVTNNGIADCNHLIGFDVIIQTGSEYQGLYFLPFVIGSDLSFDMQTEFAA